MARILPKIYHNAERFFFMQYYIVIGLTRDSDMFLAPPNSQCRRTESKLSFESGVCSCAELQVCSCCRGWKEAYQATRAISKTSVRELSSCCFFPLQVKAPKEIHAILTETLGEHATSYATVKNWVAQFKRVDFFHLWWDSSRRTQKSDHPRD